MTCVLHHCVLVNVNYNKIRSCVYYLHFFKNLWMKTVIHYLGSSPIICEAVGNYDSCQGQWSMVALKCC